MFYATLRVVEMDTSPEYVQMCGQAKEIQKFRLDKAQWEDGDFAYTKGDEVEGGNYSECVKIIWGRKMVHAGYHNWVSHCYLPEDCIWLPRQDQLQAMVFKKTALSLASCFKDFIVRPMFDELMPNRKEQMAFMLKASMEQMWLCFVMHTLYKLRWNGSDWVAE